MFPPDGLEPLAGKPDRHTFRGAAARQYEVCAHEWKCLLFAEFRGTFRRCNDRFHYGTAECAFVKRRDAARRGASGRDDRVTQNRRMFLAAFEHHQSGGAPRKLRRLQAP